MINIGGFTLNDDTDSPVVNVTEEYFRTNSGIIIGGQLKATITGTVSIDDSDDSSVKTGSIVMGRLAAIRNLGKMTKCVNVSIPNFSPCGGKAKVTNVTINQGPDPSWVNQGEYTIEVTGAVEDIPSNPFGIVAADGVTEFTRDETMEFGEDSHGYVYDASVGASKAFIKFINNITIKTENLCCGSTNSMTLFNRLVKIGPTLPIFSSYRSWSPFLHSRSMTLENDGRISFKCEIIYTPPGTNFGAFVDLDFTHSRSYQSNDTTYITSGSVTGLVSLNWTDIITLSDTCSSSKLANAIAVYYAIAAKYKDFGAWGGSTLELQLQPNCPREDEENSGSFVNCRSIGNDNEDDEEGDDPSVIEPSNSTVAISRTEGVVNFTFEWSTIQKENSGGDCFEDGIKKETTVEITNPQPSIIEHIIPGKGTLLQNLNCATALKVTITVSETYPNDKGSCDKDKSQCRTNDGIDIAVERYVPKNAILIDHTITETNNSYSVKQTFIECS
jgi:hypothetical protein